MVTVTLRLRWDEGSNTAQRVGTTAAKSDNQNSIPGTPLVKRRKGLLKRPLTLYLHLCVCAQAGAHVSMRVCTHH